jgi:signal transduction histidine kinase
MHCLATPGCGPFNEVGTRGPFNSHFDAVSYQETMGNSNYNALEVNLHHNSGPLEFLVRYTYSKSIDHHPAWLNPARHVEAAHQELMQENAERRRTEESMHRVSGRLLQVQDEERRHIARELHDSTAQSPYGVAIKLRRISESSPAQEPQSEQLLTESRQLAEQCLSEMRTMAYLLHPPSG